MCPTSKVTSLVLLFCLYAFLRPGSSLTTLVQVNGDLVVEQLTQLAQFSDHAFPAVTRVIFTANDILGRSYVKELMLEAGLTLREDAMGNIFGRWEGSQPDAPPVLTGSHCDAIPKAGMYDGTLGVIGAVEALAALKRAGFVPERSLEVLMFTSEEPTRWGLSCIGSRAMAGVLDVETLTSKRDENGTTFLEAAKDAGYAAHSVEEMLQQTRIPAGRYSYFVELHIEQGPFLEQDGINIGVVTAIAAPAALNVEFEGDGGHAGGQLMPSRNDASLAASELALALEKHVLATGAIDTVGTVGRWEIGPNAVNSVPRQAKLGIDIRDINGPRRDQVIQSLKDSAQDIAARRRVRHTVTLVNQDPPATSSEDVIRAVQAAADKLGLSSKKMVSRAYHDSLFMARFVPTGMIFIPCKNGWSHRPDEFASVSDIQNGVSVLALAMAELAGGTWSDTSAHSDAKDEL